MKKTRLRTAIILTSLLVTTAVLFGCERSRSAAETPHDPPAETTSAAELPRAPEIETDQAVEYVPSSPSVRDTEPREQVTVRFVDQNGKMILAQTVDRYDSIETPDWLAAPVGYSMAWMDDDGVMYENGDPVILDRDTYFKAVLTALPVKVEVLHGNSVIRSLEASYGEDFELPAYPSDIPFGYYFDHYMVNGRQYNVGDRVKLDGACVQASGGEYTLTVRAQLSPVTGHRWTVTETQDGNGLLVSDTVYWAIDLLDYFSKDLFNQGYVMTVSVSACTSKGESHCEKVILIAMCDTPDINVFGDENFGPSVIGKEEQASKRYGTFSATAKVPADTLTSTKLNVALRTDVAYLFDGLIKPNSYYVKDVTIVVEFHK